MATDRLEALRKLYDLPSGEERAPRDDVLFWHFRLAGATLPGFVPERVQLAHVFGAPANLSAWRPTSSAAGRAVVTIESLEAPSRTGARDMLLELLGTFQGPPLRRVQDAESPGDVAFVFGSGALLFTRGNLAVAVRDGGGDVPVGSLARAVDAFLLERPEPSPAGPRLQARAEAAPGAGGPVSLFLEATSPRGRDIWFKLFTGSGTLRLVEGRPAYVARADAPEHEVLVYALDTDGNAARATVRIGG